MFKLHKIMVCLMAVLFLAAAVSVGAQEKAPAAAPPAAPPAAAPPAAPPAPAPEPPLAKPYPMGQVRITLTQMGAGIGYEWGKGTLTYKGKKYTFKVKGLQVATVGIKRAHVKGDVYNLFSVGQFPGAYAAAEAGATVIKGEGGLILQNQQGVRLHLKGVEKGLNLSIGPEGFTIAMEKAL